MCLYFNPYAQTLPTEPQEVYKVFRYYFDTENVESPYVDINWGRVVEDDVLKSTRGIPTLDFFEVIYREITQGLHCFYDEQQARELLKAWLRQPRFDKKKKNKFDYRIAVLSGNPEHFVAQGEFEGKRSAVYTRLTFKRWL